MHGVILVVVVVVVVVVVDCRGYWRYNMQSDPVAYSTLLKKVI